MTSNPDNDKSRLMALIAEVSDHFVVPEIESPALARFSSMRNETSPLFETIARNFEQSMNALISTASIPYTLMAARVTDHHWNHFFAAEKIRTLTSKYDQHSEEEKTSIAVDAATKAFDEFSSSERGRHIVMEGMCLALKTSLDRGLSPAIAHNLVQQCLIVGWTNFEVLFRDTFECLLNQEPEKATKLQNDASSRRRFEIDKIPFEILSGNNFDLRSKMGTILVGRNDFSDLSTIKDAFFALYPTEESLRSALNSKKLWDFCQVRHLFVHRGGIVDQRYLKATGAVDDLGSRLRIAPAGLENFLEVAIQAGGELLSLINRK